MLLLLCPSFLPLAQPQQVLEVKLQKANAALMKTFSGDSCNALTELRSYRVPPPLTFGVLQCVLMLSGNVDEEDCRWGARLVTAGRSGARGM